MTGQAEIQFETKSPINFDKLTKQNKILWEHLLSGKTINMLQAPEIGIRTLHSRIAEIRKAIKNTNYLLHSRFIRVNNVSVKEYILLKDN